LLGRYVREQGFRVSVAANRREFDAFFAERNPDLLVLDVLLPDGSGLDICRVMRSQRQQVPIILLTALKEDVDRIIG
ncbi:response regulator, partial [Mycobacterium tuberculosis]|nr:response regulator [Mycobacterium tuberculosis]